MENLSRQQENATIKLTLLSRDQTQALLLPRQPEGDYCIWDNDTDRKLISVRGKEGRWYLFSESASFVSKEHTYVAQVAVANRETLALEGLDDNRRYHLLIEHNAESSSLFHKYQVEEDSELKIGRNPDNDICFSMPLVSRQHAVLTYHAREWWLYDENSANGTYVNGFRKRQVHLHIGDSIYIMGLCIIIGAGFVAINAEKKDIALNPEKLKRLQIPQYCPEGRAKTGKEPEITFFNRLPRKKAALECPDIEILAPPVSLKTMRIPMLLRYGGSLLTGNITSMLTSTLFPVLAQKYTEKEKKEYEEHRQEKYTRYLEEKVQELRMEQEKEQRILNENYPLLAAILSYPEGKKQLWERRVTDDDFLKLRVGTGEIPLMAKCDYPKKRIDMDDDPLEKLMYDLAEQKIMLHNVPVMTSFYEEFICGVLGPRPLCLDLLYRLVLRLSILYSYDEVKFVFLMDKSELKHFRFIKFLPHCWDDQQTIRFIATDTMEACSIGEYMQKELEKEERRDKIDRFLKQHPYYIVFAFQKKIFDSIEAFKEILAEEKNIGFSILNIYGQLPKECSKIFYLSEKENKIVHLRKQERETEYAPDDYFRMDAYDSEQAARSMKALANVKLRTQESAFSLPKMITFLELFGVGKIEQLNPLKRWSDNNPVKSLAAPVGVGLDGALFDLDLHEKRQGPHGLIAGMTGSGKSEFIITYILSMAVNYHPDEVAFILIDYKGGGLTGAFEDEERGIHLPHLVGTITNLDGAAIQRSLASIQSELLRRQAIFNEAKSISNEGTMDIYTYQKLYRQGIMANPLPHLFIISDEFAELKAQRPEFMEKLISTARIGRSLGVHLILATQKPSGVVDNQIWSNTKFRVCLRVQDRSDSMDMIKRPEAAELKDTGRFYLQVGYNEYFAMGQSAWCGAEYEPQEEAAAQQDHSVSFVDTVGHIILEEKPKVVRNNSGMKQIVAIVNYLSGLAERNHIAPRKLWQPALPFVLTLEQLEKKYSPDYGEEIQALVGEADDPEKQSQYPLLLNLQSCQHYIIMGEAGSGKTTLIQTMLMSLASRYTPEWLNFYLMDFSGHTLKIFKPLPHCGMYIDEEEGDGIRRFFEMLRSIMEERKKLFDEAEVSSYNAYVRCHPLPLVLVIIDNFSALQAIDNNLYFGMDEYLRDGVGLGIKFIMSGNLENDFGARIRQNAKNRITLRLKDRFDYSSVLGCKCTYEPPEGAGRGFCNYGGRPLEYQAALSVGYTQEQERIQVLKDVIGTLKGQYAGYRAARKLPAMNEEETFEEFCSDIGLGRLAIGYSVEQVKKIAVPFQQLFSLSVYFGNQDGVAQVLWNFLYTAACNHMKVYIVKQRKNSIFGEDSIGGLEYGAAIGNPITGNEAKEKQGLDVRLLECSEENLTFLWKMLSEEIFQRMQIRDQYCEQNQMPPKQQGVMRLAAPYLRERAEPILILWERFADFCEVANDDCLKIFPKLFTEGKWYHYYFLACFYPEDARKLNSELLFQKYNPDKLSILFGGRFGQQNLVTLPGEYAGIQKEAAFNRGLMHYQGSIHPIIMPCGEIAEEEQDMDEMPLF